MTVVEEPVTAPTPLSMLVVLAFTTAHMSIELCPDVIEEGVAVNDEIVGTGCATVALHDVVATVEDASVT
jgi:hypothetical protein